MLFFACKKYANEQKNGILFVNPNLPNTKRIGSQLS